MFKNTITFSYPDLEKAFIVECNASDFKIGNVLLQVIRPEVKQHVS